MLKIFINSAGLELAKVQASSSGHVQMRYYIYGLPGCTPSMFLHSVKLLILQDCEETLDLRADLCATYNDSELTYSPIDGTANRYINCH